MVHALEKVIKHQAINVFLFEKFCLKIDRFCLFEDIIMLKRDILNCFSHPLSFFSQ